MKNQDQNENNNDINSPSNVIKFCSILGGNNLIK